MKNKILKPLSIVLALGSIVSCNLDLYPDTSIPYDKDVPMIQTEEDLNGYDRGVYANFRACQSGTFKIADDVMFDAFNATTEYGNRLGGLHRLDGSFTSADEYVTDFWYSLYVSIKNYNIAIEQVPMSTLDREIYGDALDNLMADAKAARAWSYLQLARRFGKAYNPATAATDLCVPLELVYDQNSRPARASVKAVYDQIKSDLDDAYSILKDEEGEAGSQYFNVDVLRCMYANWHLDTQNYEKAYAYADTVISNTAYALCEDEKEFAAEYFEDAGKEAIMMLPTSLTELVGGYGEYINYDADSNSPTKDSFGSGYIPSKTLVSSYDATDLRLKYWFNDTADIPFVSNGSYYQGAFYVFVKYQGNTALNASGDIDGHVAPKPFALPEMYLVAAEAAFKANKKLQAMSKLTTLQSKRGATPTASITLEAIQKEWFRETVGDGLRLECLKRWGLGYSSREGQTGALAKNVLIVTNGYVNKSLPANDYHLCWPIPAYELKVNANLKQNDGYASVSVD